MEHLLEKYSVDEFCDMLESKEGWSVAGQCRNILEGESLEE